MKYWVLTLLAFLSSTSIAAAADDDAARPLQLGLRPAASPQMERLINFHDGLMVLITIITIFVMCLLVWVMLRYNKKANPKPSTTTHNIKLEIVWTLIPALIVITMMFPSLKMLYYLDRTDDPELTLKVTGYQWYWGYEYQDQDGLSFLSYMIPSDEIDEGKGQKRLLSTDNPVVLPIDTNIQILITAADVIHAFTIPAFGIKKDAVPGRMNETWVRIDKPGTYFGQCSEICGKDHAYMPIEIKAVTKDEFEKWLIEAKEKFASVNHSPLQLASVQGVQ